MQQMAKGGGAGPDMASMMGAMGGMGGMGGGMPGMGGMPPGAGGFPGGGMPGIPPGMDMQQMMRMGKFHRYLCIAGFGKHCRELKSVFFVPASMQLKLWVWGKAPLVKVEEQD